MTDRKEKTKPGQGVLYDCSIFSTGEITEVRVVTQGMGEIERKQRYYLHRFSDNKCRQRCPKPEELSTSDILCFQPGFYPRDGEQMAGTGVLRGSLYLLLSRHA